MMRTEISRALRWPLTFWPKTEQLPDKRVQVRIRGFFRRNHDRELDDDQQSVLIRCGKTKYVLTYPNFVIEDPFFITYRVIDPKRSPFEGILIVGRSSLNCRDECGTQEV